MQGQFTTPHSEYAKAHGVSRQAIERAIKSGLIKMGPNGLIDPAQADASWGAQRSARMADQSNDAGRANSQAKIMQAIALYKFTNDRFEAVRQRYIGRAEALSLATADTTGVAAHLAAVPKAYAPLLAQTLGCKRQAARRALGKFIKLVASELGDLPAEVRRSVELL